MKFKYLVPLLMLLTPIGYLFAENKAPQVKVQGVGDDDADEPVSEAPSATQAKGKTKKDSDKSGDTYNFYFQKSKSSNKVEQGKTQKVEQEKTEEPEASVSPPIRETNPVVNLMLGIIFVPSKSAAGLVLGGDFVPRSKLGAKIEIFSVSKSAGGESSFTAFGTKEDSTKNEIIGGDIALTFNLLTNEKIKISPFAGLLLLNDSSTTTSHVFDAFGTNDSSKSNSHFHILPVAGMSGTAYFSKNMGASLAFGIPIDPKYSFVSVSFVLSI